LGNEPKFQILQILNYFKSILILVFLLFSTGVSAQLEQTKRLEFELSSNSEEDYQMIPLAERGFVMMHSKNDYLRRNPMISFQKYDSTFNKIWETTFRPDDEYDLLKSYYNDNFLFALFKKGNESKIGILRIDFDSGDKIYNEGDMLTNMDVEHFTILRSKAIITGQYNDRPVAVLFSLFDKTSKVLPELHANYFDIVEIDVNEQSENIYIMLKNQRNCNFVMKTYNYEGKMLKTTQIGDRSQTPVSGKILNLNDKEIILTGSFSEGCSLLSNGIYVHHLGQENPQFIRFEELDNFFKFLSPKREAKVKERIKNKKKKGKEVNLRYRLHLHDIVQNEDGWILIAEIFYPEYKSPSSTVFSNMNNYRIGTDVYNNFRFTHTVLCGFDKSGKLLWNNSVSMENVESGELNDKVQIFKQNDSFVLAYPNEEFIKTILIKGNETPQNLEKYSLKQNNEISNITETKESNLHAWYQQNFLSYGYQSVKKGGALSSKEVFFVNKLSYKVASQTKE
jgi:hypothetical protein